MRLQTNNYKLTPNVLQLLLDKHTIHTDTVYSPYPNNKESRALGTHLKTSPSQPPFCQSFRNIKTAAG